MDASNGADEFALEKSLYNWIPADPLIAEKVLKETKKILDRLGVIFFLRQGTCLGLIRDNGFIPWDDDLDLGSVIGLNGLTFKVIKQVVDTFRDCGFFIKVETRKHYIYVAMIKSSVRIDWMCYRIIKDSIYHYPGIKIPIRLFTNLKEVDFMNEKFCVPNPPEEYLNFKYGTEWMIPKKIGFEKDIMDSIPESPAPGHPGKWKQFLIKHILPWRTSRIRVFDLADKPVVGADVVIAGLGRFRTNRQGYTDFYLPYNDFYALIVRYGGHEEVLYEEKMNQGETYIYKPDNQVTSGRYFVLMTKDQH